MSTTPVPCISLRFITKRASGMAVTSRPTPQFISSKNSKWIKCGRRDYSDSFQFFLSWFFRIYRSYLTLYVTKNYRQLSIHSYYVRTSNMIYLSLSPEHHSIRIWKVSLSVECYFPCYLASGIKILCKIMHSGSVTSPVYMCIDSSSISPSIQWMRRELGTALVLSTKNREDFCREVDFHSFPVDQRGFEVSALQSHVPHIGSPLIASKHRMVCRFICDVSLLCHERTNARTLFVFVRPSFQSRESIFFY